MLTRPRLRRRSAAARPLSAIALSLLLILQNILLTAPAARAAAATPVSLTAINSPFVENFDQLANSGTAEETTVPSGFTFIETGTNANTTYAADTGTNNGGNTYSYGATGSTERALGSLRSGSLISTLGARFTNNTNATITSLAISYTGEQWRLGTAGRADRLDFSYSTNATSLTSGAYTDVDALDFSTPNTSGTAGARDGNASANRTAISSTITGLSIAPGASFFIRWTDFDATGADDGLAIDDFSIIPQGAGGTPTPTPDPSPTPTPTPTPSVTPINQVQGSGTASPLAGQSVTTSGVVTGLRSNGFFLQTPDAQADTDANTSEGILVFTSSAPPSTAAIGNSVIVTGTITEFRPTADPNSPPETEITSPTVTLVSTGNALPAPVTLTAAETTQASETANTLDTLEEYEGMRVRVAQLTVVAPTGGSVNEPTATSTTNGVFFGVVAGVARPFREPGIELPDPVPSPVPSPNNVPRFDTNPERLRVDSDAQTGAIALEVTSGATVSELVGVLDYAFRAYTILPDAPSVTPTATVTGNRAATPVPVAAANELTVGSFNLERFFDDTNDPAIGEPVLTTAAYNNRLGKASLAIRNVLRTPDVLGVIEVENLQVLQTLATRINNDEVSAGRSNPNYQAYLQEGNDVGGIDVGFLVKTTRDNQPRINVISVTQEGKNATYTVPDTGAQDLTNDRPPLVLQASGAAPSNQTVTFTVIVNHLRSLNGVETDDASGRRIRAKRRAQAEFLANLVQTRQQNNPAEPIALVGDFNAFEVNDGYVDVINTIKGTPTPASQVVLASPDLVNPDLVNLADRLPATDRYSYVFDGNAQILDHIIVNDDFDARFSRFAYARLDADFPESYRSDPNRPERLSDHDAPVAYFSLGTSAPAEVTSQVSVTSSSMVYNRVTRTFNSTITITNTSGSAIGAPVQLVFDDLTQGVTLVNQTGTFAGDPYITATTTNLAPGASVQVVARFNNPNNVRIGYTPRVFSGAVQ